MTTNFQEMIQYTKNEWNNSDSYFGRALNLAKERKIKSFVDLGSCLGEVSKIFLEAVPSIKKIIAIEAMPQNFDFLITNLKSDTCDITYVNKAVFYGASTVKMGTSHSNVGGFGIHAEGILNNNEKVLDGIETTTLEKIFGELEIDFMKIDIEGAEKNVLENSTSIRNVKLIELELHDSLESESIHLPFLQEYLPNHRVVETLYRGHLKAGNNILLEKV